MTPSPPADDLRALAARGVVWATLGQGGSVALHYVIMLLLAWRLGPPDFGLVGLATIYVFIVCAVAELGVGVAIVQRPELRTGHIAASFWASLLAGLALAVGVSIASRSIAHMMHEPR